MGSARFDAIPTLMPVPEACRGPWFRIRFAFRGGNGTVLENAWCSTLANH